MNCYIHPEREAGWTCAACGKPVCPECKVTLAGKVYCNPCADKMYQAALKSWFEKHLNWTMAIGLFVWVILIFIGGVILSFINADLPEEALSEQIQIVGYVLDFLFLFPIAGWVIRKKGRNPWNILWLIAPFGVVMIFLLSNLNNAPQNSPGTPRIS